MLQKILKHQLKEEEKLGFSSAVIDSSGTFENTRNQALNYFNKLKENTQRH